MNEKLKKKLQKLLSKAGLDEDKIEKVLAEVENPNEDTDKGEEETVETAPVVEGEGEPAPVDEPLPDNVDENAEPQPEVPQAMADVPPTEEQPMPQPPVEETPVQEEQPVPVPQPDGQMQELLKANEELKGALDGLMNRINALEQALKDGGIMEDSNGEDVGVDKPNAPANNPVDDPMTEVLAQLNRGRR